MIAQVEGGRVDAMCVFVEPEPISDVVLVDEGLGQNLALATVALWRNLLLILELIDLFIRI